MLESDLWKRRPRLIQGKLGLVLPVFSNAGIGNLHYIGIVKAGVLQGRSLA